MRLIYFARHARTTFLARHNKPDAAVPLRRLPASTAIGVLFTTVVSGAVAGHVDYSEISGATIFELQTNPDLVDRIAVMVTRLDRKWYAYKIREVIDRRQGPIAEGNGWNRERDEDSGSSSGGQKLSHITVSFREDSLSA
jgi:hypothetical protein